VTTLLKALFAAIAGLALGLWATRVMLANGGPFEMVSLGAWSVATRAGAVDADPYTRASLARSGEIPLALGEGLQLIARVDDSGRPLNSRCVYRIGPRVPAARYWTLGIVDRKGYPLDNTAGRYVFRSSEILREADGSFAIYVSAAAHSGNWLPIGAPVRFALMLRLYDSPLSATAGGIEKGAPPAISRESCA
jgi:hypothetical protein